MGSTWSGPGRKTTDFARKLFPIVAVLTIFFSFLLLLPYLGALAEPGSPTDRSYVTQTDILALISVLILASGIVFNRKRKGVVYLALMLVLFLLAAYTIPLYLPLLL